jgi:hypothetical protein
MLDLFFSLFIVILGFIFIVSRSKLQIKDKKILIYLWVYHLFFTIVYYIYTRSNSADSNAYWAEAKNSSIEDYFLYLNDPLGTNFMYLINYLPSRILDLSIFSGTVLYSLVGFIGYYYFYMLLKILIPNNSKLFNLKLFPFLLFLPNLHFWSVGAGKDTLAFFSILALNYALMYLRNNKFLFIISSLILLFTRPHVFFIFLLSIVISFVLSHEIKSKYRILLFFISSSLLLLILPTVFNYVNLVDVGNFQDIMTRAENQANNLRGDDVGSSIDTSSYSFLFKIFSFLYRPLFLDYSGLFSLISSLENLILLSISFRVFGMRFVRALKLAPFIIKLNFYFFLFGTIMFSFTLSNLGIYLRMKNMLIPSFIILILWNLSFTFIQKNNKNGVW